MPSPFTHIRRHSANTIGSISSTITSFCMPSTTRVSSKPRVFSASTKVATSATSSKAVTQAPMKVVKRQLRTVSARNLSYSGLFVTSFLLASFLPFQLAPSGSKGGRGSRKPERQSRGKADPDRHDMDSKSMASDSSAKNKQHRASSTESKPQIHANHRSGSSLRSSHHGASYRPRRTGMTTAAGSGRGGQRTERGAAGRASAKKQKDARMALRRQGWR